MCQLTYGEFWLSNSESIDAPQEGEGRARCDAGLNIQGFLPNSISKDAYQLTSNLQQSRDQLY